ncbi:MAG: hypothetical protein MUP80_03180 [Acidobacteriia bacterium]|nr:hypothetical protein [Terriglobia bacterium]
MVDRALPKDSKQYAELKKSLDAIGSRGDKNGVIVNFGETRTKGPMETFGKQITVDWKALDDGVALYQAAGYKTDAGVEAAAEAGHEGIHVTRPIHMSERNRWAIVDSVEREAYGVQSSVSEAGGSESVVWNNSWAKSADRETLRQNAVKEAARQSVDTSRQYHEGRKEP